MDSTVSDVDTVDLKRLAKLTQLGHARETANLKKRRRDEDLAFIRDKITILDEKLTTASPAVPEPVATKPPVVTEVTTAKRQKIVTKEEDVSEPATESWSTELIRTSDVLGLGAASYWFQHRYGKPIIVQKKPEIRPTPTATKAPIMPIQNRAKSLLTVGESGFTQ
jgi:hypothetical protein